MLFLATYCQAFQFSGISTNIIGMSPEINIKKLYVLSRAKNMTFVAYKSKNNKWQQEKEMNT